MSSSTNLYLSCQAFDCARPLEYTHGTGSQKVYFLATGVISCSTCALPLFCSKECQDLSSRVHEVCCEKETSEGGIPREIHLKILFNAREAFSKLILKESPDHTRYLHLDLYSDDIFIHSKVEDSEKISPYTSWHPIKESLELPVYVQVRLMDQEDPDEISFSAKTDLYKEKFVSDFDLEKKLQENIEQWPIFKTRFPNLKLELAEIENRLSTAFRAEVHRKKILGPCHDYMIKARKKIKKYINEQISTIFFGLRNKIDWELSTSKYPPYNFTSTHYEWIKTPKIEEIREIQREVQSQFESYVKCLCFSVFLSLPDEIKQAPQILISKAVFYDSIEFMKIQLEKISQFLGSEIEDNIVNVLERYLKEKQRQPLLGGVGEGQVLVRCRGNLEEAYFDDTFKLVRVDSTEEASSLEEFSLDSGLESESTSQPQTPLKVTEEFPFSKDRLSSETSSTATDFIAKDSLASTPAQEAVVPMEEDQSSVSEKQKKSDSLGATIDKKHPSFNLASEWFYRNNQLRPKQENPPLLFSSPLYKMEKP